MRKVVQAPARRTQDPTWARPSQTDFPHQKNLPCCFVSRLVFSCSAIQAARKTSNGVVVVVVVGLNFVVGQDGRRRRSAKDDGFSQRKEGALHRRQKSPKEIAKVLGLVLGRV